MIMHQRMIYLLWILTGFITEWTSPLTISEFIIGGAVKLDCFLFHHDQFWNCVRSPLWVSLVDMETRPPTCEKNILSFD